MMTKSPSLAHIAGGAALGLALISSARASAEITDSAPGGFTIRETAHIAASPDKVYAALIAPQHWWSGKHSFSGDAANFSFDARAGGCWCETLPGGGSVEHMTIVYALPGKALRLRGAMGPFQAMAVISVLDWSLKPAGDGTDVTLIDTTGGYTSGGLQSITPVVDTVFAEQTLRLKRYVETGSPEGAAKP